ncbi:hypothetical protein KUTeg_016959 [Tegillarca granosa]|uniref:Uncharacterized protein n=1 Tax=Tegillarca granosa TaxID=220873 RepID=A0ABQ9EMH9_TEGGR|nr:hypothetical protein KUTeg_016959 [Tegillarca granosa]
METRPKAADPINNTDIDQMYNAAPDKNSDWCCLNNTRTGQPRMYELSEKRERCPVTTYKIYADKRPSNFSQPEHSFYLVVVTHTHVRRLIMNSGPIGKNKLNTLLKVMAKSAGVNMDKRLTNTSARKHLCQTLINNNVFDEQAAFWIGR